MPARKPVPEVVAWANKLATAGTGGGQRVRDLGQCHEKIRPERKCLKEEEDTEEKLAGTEEKDPENHEKINQGQRK